MSNSVNLQHKIKSNAEELQTFIQDLYQWEDDIKQKDEGLRNRKRSVTDSDSNTKLREMNHGSSPAKRPEVNTREPLKKETLSTKVIEESPIAQEKTKLHQQQEAILQKDKGNEYFKQGKFEAAAQCYSTAMDLDKASAILPANRAMAYLKLNKFNKAEEDCTLSLKLDPSYLKAYHRRGCARVQLGKYAEAEEDFRKVLAMEPHNKAAEQELNNLKTKTKTKTLPTQKQTPTVEKPKFQETKRSFSNLFQVMEEVQATKKNVKGSNLIAVPISSAKNDTEEDEKIKKIFQEWSKPLKTEKPVEPVLKLQEVKIPAVPKTSFQFTNDWKKLGSDFDLKCRYLQQISPEKLPDIFRDAMESEILGDIVKILVNQLLFSNEQRSAWLVNLARVKRIGAVSLFLPEDQKKDLRSLLENLKGSTEEWESLRKKFGV